MPLHHVVEEEPFFYLKVFGLFIGGAGGCSDEELLRRLGYPRLDTLVEHCGDVCIRQHGDWHEVRAARGQNSYGLHGPLCRSGELGKPVPPDAPLLHLEGLVEDFDVFDYLLPDAGLGYRFELYREGRLARRVVVAEVEPWSEETYVKTDLGAPLPGEPREIPVGSPARAEEVVLSVLIHLGAVPTDFARPAEYRRYARDTLRDL